MTRITNTDVWEVFGEIFGDTKLLFNSKTALQWKKEIANQITRNDTVLNLTKPPPVGGGKRPYLRDCPLEYTNARKVWANVYRNLRSLIDAAHKETVELIQKAYESRLSDCYWLHFPIFLFAYSECLSEAGAYQLTELQKENGFYTGYVKDLNDWYKKIQLDMLLNYTRCCSSVSGIASCSGGASQD